MFPSSGIFSNSPIHKSSYSPPDSLMAEWEWLISLCMEKETKRCWIAQTQHGLRFDIYTCTLPHWTPKNIANVNMSETDLIVVLPQSAQSMQVVVFLQSVQSMQVVVFFIVGSIYAGRSIPIVSFSQCMWQSCYSLFSLCCRQLSFYSLLCLCDFDKSDKQLSQTK